MGCWENGILMTVGNWIYHFQVLIGALLASVAAIMTVRNIRAQITQTRKHRAEELASAKVAARIEALWAFLRISEYDNKCLSYIAETNTQKDTYKHVKGSLGKPPDIDMSVIPALSKLAANSTPAISNKIQNYLAHLQIQSSRQETLRDSLAGRAKMHDGTVIHQPSILKQALLDHYILKFQTNRLLGYCRGDFEGVPDLMNVDDFVSEITKFPDISFLTQDMTDYVSLMWPENGWWTIM